MFCSRLDEKRKSYVFADEVNNRRVIGRHDLESWMNPLPSEVTMNLLGDDESTV